MVCYKRRNNSHLWDKDKTKIPLVFIAVSTFTEHFKPLMKSCFFFKFKFNDIFLSWLLFFNLAPSCIWRRLIVYFLIRLVVESWYTMYRTSSLHLHPQCCPSSSPSPSSPWPSPPHSCPPPCQRRQHFHWAYSSHQASSPLLQWRKMRVTLSK